MVDAGVEAFTKVNIVENISITPFELALLQRNGFPDIYHCLHAKINENNANEAKNIYKKYNVELENLPPVKGEHSQLKTVIKNMKDLQVDPNNPSFLFNLVDRFAVDDIAAFATQEREVFVKQICFQVQSDNPKTLWQLALEESKYWNGDTQKKRLDILFHLAGVFHDPNLENSKPKYALTRTLEQYLRLTLMQLLRLSMNIVFCIVRCRKIILIIFVHF